MALATSRFLVSHRFVPEELIGDSLKCRALNLLVAQERYQARSRHHYRLASIVPAQHPTVLDGLTVQRDGPGFGPPIGFYMLTLEVLTLSDQPLPHHTVFCDMPHLPDGLMHECMGCVWQGIPRQVRSIRPDQMRCDAEVCARSDTDDEH